MAQQAVLNDNLCAGNEEVLVSFRMRDSARTVSILIARDESYIVYRFGSRNNVELEFPAVRADSWSRFTYTYHWSRYTRVSNLEFTNGGFKYTVIDNTEHDDFLSPETVSRRTCGIRVTNMSTNRVTELAGIPSSFVGSWDRLLTSRRIRKIELGPEVSAQPQAAAEAQQVYIAGNDGTDAVYWLNGRRNVLPKNSASASSSAIAVIN